MQKINKKIKSKTYKIDSLFSVKSSRKLFSEAGLKDKYKGDITFNALKKAGFASDKKTDKYKYPFVDSGTLNNHIKGYCSLKNFSGKGIKVSESGDAGKSILINGDYFVGRPSYILINDEFVNEFTASLMNKLIPRYKQTSVISNVMYAQIKDIEISIPENHKDLSKIIKNMNKFKNISNEATRRFKSFKKSIIQTYKKNLLNTTEKNNNFIEIKVSEAFQFISGKGSFNKMLKSNEASVEYNIENGYIYPFYDGSTLKNHIKGYVKSFNFEGRAIKVAKDGAESGSTKYIEGKSYNADHSYYLVSEEFANEFMALLMSDLLPGYRAGTSIPSVKYNDYKDLKIWVPKNHKEIAKAIRAINDWHVLTNESINDSKKYIRGIINNSLKGEKNE